MSFRSGICRLLFKPIRFVSAPCSPDGPEGPSAQIVSNISFQARATPPTSCCRSLILIALICFSSGGFCKTSQAADVRTSDWRILVPLGPGKPAPTTVTFVRVTLPSSILAESLAGLEDIRVVDGSATEVPYVLVVERSQALETNLPASILDRGVVPDQYQQLVCDLGEGKFLSNELRLETSARNFRRRVEILGSSDGNDWVRLKSGSHIFDQHEEFQFQNLRVAYPETGYRFLKLILWLDGGKPLDIVRVSALRVIRREVRPERVPARIVGRQEDVERKATDLLIETDLERQHLEACVPQVAQENFQRRAEVSFQDRERVWVKVGAGDLYRFKVGEIIEGQLRIPISDLNEKRFRLRIWNRDSPPLEVTSVVFERMPRVVVFQWDPSKSYRLFAGNAGANHPAYDLETATRRLDISQLPSCETGPVSPNPGYRPKETSKPWTEQHPVLLWSGLSFGVLCLGWMLLRTLREL